MVSLLRGVKVCGWGDVGGGESVCFSGVGPFVGAATVCGEELVRCGGVLEDTLQYESSCSIVSGCVHVSHADVFAVSYHVVVRVLVVAEGATVCGR